MTKVITLNRTLPLLLAAAGLASACVSDPSGDEEIEVLAVPRISLLALTEIDASEAPVLGDLVENNDLVDGRALEQLLADPDALRSVLEGTASIIANVELLDDEDIALFKPLIDMAVAAQVPLILENVDDPDVMAALIGVGVASEIAVIEPNGSSHQFEIILYGDLSEITDESGAAVSPALDRDDHLFISEELIERLLARNEDEDFRNQAWEENSSGHWSYLVHPAQNTTSWSPGNGQYATSDVHFLLQLVDSDTPRLRFLVVSGAGSGMNPGSLYSNSGDRRAHFQDKIRVRVTPNSQALTSFAHEPHTANKGASTSTSTGCSVEAGWPPSLSCDISNSTSTTYNDFEIIDQTAGLTALWDYRMAWAQGSGGQSSGPYDSWDDLRDWMWGYLRNPVQLAKSTLVPKFEVVYAASTDFAGTVPVQLVTDQQLRNTWVNWWFFGSTIYSSMKSQVTYLDASVDFSRLDAN